MTPVQPPTGCGLAFQQLVETLLPAGEVWAPLHESALAAMQLHAGVKVRRSCAWLGVLMQADGGQLLRCCPSQARPHARPCLRSSQARPPASLALLPCPALPTRSPPSRCLRATARRRVSSRWARRAARPPAPPRAPWCSRALGSSTSARCGCAAAAAAGGIAAAAGLLPLCRALDAGSCCIAGLPALLPTPPPSLPLTALSSPPL